jgi:hypothetical protein
VQFDHRAIAWLLFLLVPTSLMVSRKVRLRRARLAATTLALALQIALGSRRCY